jgi:SAM-dependent methyltransferase
MKVLPESAEAIAQFFRHQGYTEKILAQLGLAELGWNSRLTRLASALVVTGDDRLDLLIRLFYLGESVAAGESEELVPKKILRHLLEGGFLERDGERVRPACMLMHFGELILASDPRRNGEAHGPGLVLGVNQTTQLLARCTILPAGGKALDLGTGCGTLALAAAPNAASVMGTDINPRALEFAALNAALNGVTNVSFLQGDRFDPVVGERFDSIVSNPPFFLAPVSGLVYCDNSMHLDGFVESLARSAPKFLEKDGVFQMLCEWVELESEPWEERLKPWFQGSQCDVHIWQGYQFSPVDYARKRALEQSQLDPEAAVVSFRERISYLTKYGVKEVFGGLISIRRRSGENWFWVEEMKKRPAGPIGEALRERFSTRDILGHGGQALLVSRPKLPANVHLLSESTQQRGVWLAGQSYLERMDDLPAKMGLDAVVAQLAARFDGREALETLLRHLASERNIPLEGIIPEGLRVVEKLAVSGLIVLEEGQGIST